RTGRGAERQGRRRADGHLPPHRGGDVARQLLPPRAADRRAADARRRGGRRQDRRGARARPGVRRSARHRRRAGGRDRSPAALLPHLQADAGRAGAGGEDRGGVRSRRGGGDHEAQPAGLPRLVRSARTPCHRAGAAARAARALKLTLTRHVLIGLVLGVLAGWLAGPQYAQYFRPFSQIFLRLVKMLIAPLIFSTLVAGVAGGGHLKVVGRMAVKAIIYFEIVTTIAIAIGLLAVNITKPGVGVVLPPQTTKTTLAPPQTWQEFLVHVFPDSVVKAMAEGEVLQIVVFSLLFAFALNLVGEKGRPVVQLCESIAET